MKLSIIIVNYRSWGFLQKALETLQPGFPPDWEIIVVDNESLAEPFHQFQQKYPWVTFVANARNSGFGFGCNLGAAQATGSYLLFMNPDVIANSKNIRSLIRVLENHPDVALISPKQVNEFGRPQKVFDDFPELLNQSKILKVLLRLFGQSPQRDLPANDATLTYCDWITGSCLLVSRADFDAIGGWSEDYWMYVEDADLCRRAQDMGMLVACASNIQVVHMRRRLMHILIAFLRLPGLSIAAALNLLTLRLVPALRVRGKVLSSLLKYYAGVRKSGDWLSPRAIENRRSSP
jgi:GT2 family glycosyltransferase